MTSENRIIPHGRETMTFLGIMQNLNDSPSHLSRNGFGH